MTEPEFANSTYIEPLTVENIEKIIIKEKPSAILPTMGGQTALNLTLALHNENILKKYKVELIGASINSIFKAEAPIDLSIPIPLVPAIPWLDIVPAAAPKVISPAVVAAFPPLVIPEMVVVWLPRVV